MLLQDGVDDNGTEETTRQDIACVASRSEDAGAVNDIAEAMACHSTCGTIQETQHNLYFADFSTDDATSVAMQGSSMSDTGSVNVVRVVYSALRQCCKDCDRLAWALDTLPIGQSITATSSMSLLASVLANSATGAEAKNTNTEHEELHPCTGSSHSQSGTEKAEEQQQQQESVSDLLDILQRLHGLLAPCLVPLADDNTSLHEARPDATALITPQAAPYNIEDITCAASPRTAASVVKDTLPSATASPAVQLDEELQRLQNKCAAQEQECASLKCELAQLQHALANAHVVHERAYMRHIVEEATRRWFLRSPALYTTATTNATTTAAIVGRTAAKEAAEENMTTMGQWALTAPSSSSEDVTLAEKTTATTALLQPAPVTISTTGLAASAPGASPRYTRQSTTQPQYDSRLVRTSHASQRATVLSQSLRRTGPTPRTNKSPGPSPLLTAGADVMHSGTSLVSPIHMPAARANQARRLRHALAEQRALSAGLQGRLSALEIQLAHTEAERVALAETLRQRARSLHEVWAMLAPEQRAMLTEYTALSTTTTAAAALPSVQVATNASADGRAGEMNVKDTDSGNATTLTTATEVTMKHGAAVAEPNVSRDVVVKSDTVGSLGVREAAVQTSSLSPAQSAELQGSAKNTKAHDAAMVGQTSITGTRVNEDVTTRALTTQRSQRQALVNSAIHEEGVMCSDIVRADDAAVAHAASEVHALQHTLRVLTAQLERMTHEEQRAQTRMTELEAELMTAYAFVQECQKMQHEASLAACAGNMNNGLHHDIRNESSPTKPREGYSGPSTRPGWGMNAAQGMPHGGTTRTSGVLRGRRVNEAMPAGTSPARRRLWQRGPIRPRTSHRTRLTYRSPLRRSKRSPTQVNSDNHEKSSVYLRPSGSRDILMATTAAQTAWEAMRNGRHLFARPTQADLVAHSSSSLIVSRPQRMGGQDVGEGNATPAMNAHSNKTIYRPGSHDDMHSSPLSGRRHRLSPSLNSARRTRWRSRATPRSSHTRRRHRHTKSNTKSREVTTLMNRRNSHEEYDDTTHDEHIARDWPSGAKRKMDDDNDGRRPSLRRRGSRRGSSVPSHAEPRRLSEPYNTPLTHNTTSPPGHIQRNKTTTTSHWPLLDFTRSHSDPHIQRNTITAAVRHSITQDNIHDNTYARHHSDKYYYYHNSSVALRLTPSAAYASRRLSQRIAAWTRPAWNASPALPSGLGHKSAMATRYFADTRPSFPSYT